MSTRKSNIKLAIALGMSAMAIHTRMHVAEEEFVSDKPKHKTPPKPYYRKNERY